MAVEAAVVVTKRSGLLTFLLLGLVNISQAAVLPADRADVMYHSYDGGGVKIDGPAVLVRKSVTDDVSVSAQYYVDEISGASIDVQVLASEYAEERTQYDIGADYLLNKTILTLGYSNSEENDYEADTYSIGVSQDFFGDLSTLSLSFALGNDTIGMSTNSEFSKDKRTQSYQFSWTQVMTKNLLMNFIYHVITDEGYLNNPYRRFRYLDSSSGSGVSWKTEVYPDTRTSHAFAVRGRYYMPYRAAFGFEYRRFNDTWGINAYNMDLNYTHPLDQHWIIDVRYRYYSQSQADFYSDLFPAEEFQNYMGRDKEISSLSSNTFGIKVSYEFDTHWSQGWLEKAAVSFAWDMLSIEYDNFRDARRDDLPAGTEPLYKLDADVIRFFISGWF